MWPRVSTARGDFLMAGRVLSVTQCSEGSYKTLYFVYQKPQVIFSVTCLGKAGLPLCFQSPFSLICIKALTNDCNYILMGLFP